MPSALTFNALHALTCFIASNLFPKPAARRPSYQTKQIRTKLHFISYTEVRSCHHKSDNNLLQHDFQPSRHYKSRTGSQQRKVAVIVSCVNFLNTFPCFLSIEGKGISTYLGTGGRREFAPKERGKKDESTTERNNNGAGAGEESATGHLMACN